MVAGPVCRGEADQRLGAAQRVEETLRPCRQRVGFGERPTAMDLLGGVMVAAALVLVRRGAKPVEPLAPADAMARPGA